VLPEVSIGVGEFSTLVSLKGGGFLGYQNDIEQEFKESCPH
jgi:hypothetical protein